MFGVRNSSNSLKQKPHPQLTRPSNGNSSSSRGSSPNEPVIPSPTQARILSAGKTISGDQPGNVHSEFDSTSAVSTQPSSSDLPTLRSIVPSRISDCKPPPSASSAGGRSSRLTKPPVPQLSARARRLRTAPESTENNEYNTDPPSPVRALIPEYSPMPLSAMEHPSMYPYMIPIMVPVTTLYGRVHPHQGATVVYTSGPIPANTTSIILVPMGTPSPSPVTPRVNGSISSENSESLWLSNQPVAIFIERNVFKQWFEGNIPSAMRDLPFRVKRYKSTETFMHWLSSRKRYEQLELILLVRVTEVAKLLSEVKNTNLKNFKIYGYEHLFDVSEQPGKSLRCVSEDLAKLEPGNGPTRINLFHSLQEACSAIINNPS